MGQIIRVHPDLKKEVLLIVSLGILMAGIQAQSIPGVYSDQNEKIRLEIDSTLHFEIFQFKNHHQYQGSGTVTIKGRTVRLHYDKPCSCGSFYTYESNASQKFLEIFVQDQSGHHLPALISIDKEILQGTGAENVTTIEKTRLKNAHVLKVFVPGYHRFQISALELVDKSKINVLLKKQKKFFLYNEMVVWSIKRRKGTKLLSSESNANITLIKKR